MEPFTISMNLFCSSLRQHPIWASTIPLLLQWQGPSRWRETPLQTHSIVLSPTTTPGGNHPPFRLLLLTPADLSLPSTSHRISQLRRLDDENGRNAAILFLVDEDVAKGATLAFTKLQTSLPPSLPLIPLHTALALPETLQTFQNSLVHGRKSRERRWPGDVASDLLPYCAVGGALKERTTEVLMGACHSVKGVVEALEEVGGEGLLVQALEGDESEARRVVAFWRLEFEL